MRKLRMATPGPTQVPQELLLAGAQELIHHRSPQMETLVDYVNGRLSEIFATRQPVYIALASGTGAMEGAVSNCFNSGDKVIVVSNGYFGERFLSIAKAYGLDTVVVDAPWGQSVDLSRVREAAERHRDAKGILVVYSETSTGVLNDVEVIGEVFRNSDTLVVVDAISGLVTHPLETDGWGLDVVVSASHKGFMLPPGLAFFSVSGKAWEKIGHVTTPSYYFSYRRARQFYPMAPSSPAVSLLLALRRSVDMLLDEGLPAIWARHLRLADAVEAGFSALGFEQFVAAGSRRSSIITVVKCPPQVSASKFIHIMQDVHGVTLTGGQSELKGKIVRFGHVGYVDMIDIIGIFGSIEMTLRGMGVEIRPGSSVAAMCGVAERSDH